MKNVAVAPPPERWVPIVRHNLLYEVLPVGFLTVDRRGKIVALNDPGARLLGFPANWLRNRPFVVFLSVKHVRRFLAFILRAKVGFAEQTIEIALSVGFNEVPVQISARAIQSDGEVFHHLTIVDL